ncbi:VIT and vWA domain-containing protein [Vibrio superstes]|uniref:Inter-alpha-trypsin inhibitor domain-containing protein n=1 Tax=Vibrio superstes NBRC 103154 TaxID=1219062 RepID=A0A511QKL3_9VIBR|nr:VIT and VWA domain-containing protein [Vibrio superstes]GEM77831.1 hypothetical protein VSU01S_00760 [Vibrio superstes NBRC 103154]
MNSVTSSPLQGASIAIDLNLPCASTRLTQVFVNDSDSVIEAVFQFPVPRNAVLGEVSVVIAGVRYEGQVSAKHRAEQTYEKGVSEGKRSVLISDLGDGLYEVNLGNLDVEETAEIELCIHQMMMFDNGQAKYFLPTVIAPKYGRSRLRLEHQPTNNALVEYAFEGHINIPSGTTLTAGSHSLDMQAEQGFFYGHLDQDISFTFDASELKSHAISVEHDGGYSVMGCVAANVSPHNQGNERAVQLLLDCSGSMGGVSMSQLKDGLEEALLDVSMTRKINVIKYGSNHQSLFLEPREFSGAYKETVSECVNQLRADMGGTNIYGALETALDQVSKSGVETDIILVTDGQVWEDEDDFGRLLEQSEKLGVRIFCIGVGYAISESILGRLSERTNGTLSLVNPHENMANAICDVMAKSQFGGMAVTIALEGDKSAFVEHPSFIYGRQMVPFFARSLAHPQTVSINIGEQPQNIAVIAASNATEQPVKQLVANSYIGSLSELEATQYAVSQGIVSKYTSYVMVSTESVENADGMPELKQAPQMQKRDRLASPVMMHKSCKHISSASYSSSLIPDACLDFDDDLSVDMIEWSSDPEPLVLSYLEQLTQIDQYLDRRHAKAKPARAVLLLSFLIANGFDIETPNQKVDEAQYCASFLLDLADSQGFEFSVRVRMLLESFKQLESI